MNAIPQPQQPATAAVPLTRAAKKRLLLQMYSVKHWIALIRLFAYQTLPMEQARNAIKPLADQFGKEPLAAACEVLVEIFTHGNETMARLKPHVRHMAFQMLGPEPVAVAAAAPAPPSVAASDTKCDSPPPERRRKPTKPRSCPTPTAEEHAPVRGATLMQQYRAAKDRHPDMLLLFRMGDFYELFDQDAETAHKLLGLTLTTRDRTVAMAGFPHHQLETYLHKLLHAGQRVAVCEPVEESLDRGPIQREITRVVTPGTMLEQDTGRKGEPDEEPPGEQARPVRQPRHLVLQRCQTWMKEGGLAFVAVDDVRRTTPAIVPYVGVLDFIVLRGDEKLLVTVRPHLLAKHLKALRELQNLYGTAYRPVRMWPGEGRDGWIWHDYPVDLSTDEAEGKERQTTSRRSRTNKSQ
jgi:hypothetical protein